MAEPHAHTIRVEPERLIGERIAGRFVIDRLVGRGELATAFRAHDDRLHRRVTVKLYHPRHRDDVRAVDAHIAAARAVARLSHENISMVIDRGEHEGLPLVVLEFVPGETLQERIDRFAPLAADEVVRYALQVARALAYAHGHGVVHGNVRPTSMQLTEERDVKLVDFGASSYLEALVGDPYLAPELRELDAGAIEPEPTDDMYALGAVLVAALTDQAPQAGMSAGMLQALRPDVSPRLAAIAARALAADPADRYLSMREMAAELAGVPELGRETRASSEPGRLLHVGEPTAEYDAHAARAGGSHDSEQTVVGVPAVGARRQVPTGRRARRQRTQPLSGREVRARLLAWSIVVVPLAALVIFGLMIAGERSTKQVAGDPSRSDRATHAAVISNITSFDPYGDDHTEHQELAANAADGKAATYWSTSQYDTSNLSGKPGVGLVYELGSAASIRSIELTTDLPGWTAQVYVAAKPGAALKDWRAASDTVKAEQHTRIRVDMPRGVRSARYAMVWITQLAVDPIESNSSAARIAETVINVA